MFEPSQTSNGLSQTSKEPSQTSKEPSQTRNEPSKTSKELSQTRNEPSQTSKEVSKISRFFGNLILNKMKINYKINIGEKMAKTIQTIQKNDDIQDYRGGLNFSDSDIQNINQEIINITQNLLENIIEPNNIMNLRRFFAGGEGERKLGFTEKTIEISLSHPHLVPPHIAQRPLEDMMTRFYHTLDALHNAQNLLDLINRLRMAQVDELYQTALTIYRNLNTLTRDRVPGAEVLFRDLATFFERRNHHILGDEPTEKQLLKDAKAVLHGKKDGKIVIEHEKPHAEGGFHKVEDDIYKSSEKTKIKITEEK